MPKPRRSYIAIRDIVAKRSFTRDTIGNCQICSRWDAIGRYSKFVGAVPEHLIRERQRHPDERTEPSAQAPWSNPRPQ